MGNDFDRPKLKAAQAIEAAENTVGLTPIEGSKTVKNKVIDVITGKIHDLPEHYLKSPNESK